ncbi:MAG: hypothetical protein Q9209_005202 [Squamulea sp. 1 TL-2023]
MVAKQILSTAKRSSKKRTLSATSATSETSQSPKRAKTGPLKLGQELPPADLEASLALPTLNLPSHDDIEAEISNTVLHTNRAPLMVAFGVQLLRYTMPSQPLSSRLSLAQAVMSMGAKAKAIHLGIQSGKTAEDEGWAEGQPSVRMMGRKIPVMRRWGYNWQDNGKGVQEPEKIKQEVDEQGPPPKAENMFSADSGPSSDFESQETVKCEPSAPPKPVLINSQSNHHPTPEIKNDANDPPLWALDIEALSKKSASGNAGLINSLPIYDPNSARNYMLKSFATSASSLPPTPSPAKILKSTALAKERERKEKENNLALLLHALDLLFASWIDVIGAEELDRRAFGWYSRVRPQVSAGREGWGGKGEVKLADLLKLRR